MTSPERLQDVTVAEVEVPGLLEMSEKLRARGVDLCCYDDQKIAEAAFRLGADAALSVRGWLPIESAPKDGTRIMLGNAHGAWMAEKARADALLKVARMALGAYEALQLIGADEHLPGFASCFAETKAAIAAQGEAGEG